MRTDWLRLASWRIRELMNGGMATTVKLAALFSYEEVIGGLVS